MKLVDVDKWAEIFDTMRRHKLRTFLTALSVWWGMIMLILLLGAGAGLENGVEYNFKDDAINSLWLYPGETSEEYRGLPKGRNVIFTNDDYDLLKKDMPGVDHVTGRYYIRGNLVVKRNNESYSFTVRCVHPDHQVLENTIIVEGRFLNDLDIREFRKVCVIGSEVKDAVYGDSENPIGTYININGFEYRIVGVFEDTGSPGEVRMMYIPITTCQKVYDGTERIHQIMLTVGDATVEESQEIEKHIRAQMGVLHKFSPSDDEALYIGNDLENYAEFKMVMAFIRGFIWFVGIGSIIAGVIGVSNIMLIVVKERTKEIGIRKALGATPRSIITLILQESIFITAVAGYVGLLMGFSMIYGVNALLVRFDAASEMFRNPEVRFSVVVIALIVLILCGALAGLIPALQAVRINPVKAMKDV